jgi:hypothetical protein
MAEEIPDGRFKDEVMRLLQTAITKVDGLEKKADENTGKLESLTVEVKTLSGQFQDVGIMAIKDNGRMTELERRVDNLETGIH